MSSGGVYLGECLWARGELVFWVLEHEVLLGSGRRHRDAVIEEWDEVIGFDSGGLPERCEDALLKGCILNIGWTSGRDSFEGREQLVWFAAKGAHDGPKGGLGDQRLVSLMYWKDRHIQTTE